MNKTSDSSVTHEITKDLFNDYRECLKIYGQFDPLSKSKREKLAEYIESDARLFFSRKGLPLLYKTFAASINPNDHRLVEDFIKKRYGSFYNFLKKIDIWKGEYLTRHKNRTVRSIDHPVIFSGNDVYWMPKLLDPSEMEVGESAGILLSSSFPCIGNREDRATEEVNTLRIKVNPYEMVYLRMHVIPLLSHVFNVPTDFFNNGFAGNKKRPSQRGNSNQPQMNINSLMVGSYFQNVVGVYENRDGVPVRVKPKRNINKEGVLRGLLDCKAQVRHAQIAFYGDEPLLEAITDYADFEVSKIKPVYDPKHMLSIVERKDKKTAICTSQRHSKIGCKVFEKTKRREVGITVEHIKGERWEKEHIPDYIVVELFSEPAGPVYQETGYAMYTRGGKDAVREIVETYISNPYRVLMFFEAYGKIAKGLARNASVQEFAYKEWKEERDLDKLEHKIKNLC